MALDNTVKLWLRGLFGSYNDSTNSVVTDVDKLYRRVIRATVPDDTGATTNVDATYFYEAQGNETIRTATVLHGDATADSTNYATFNLLKADGAGGSTSVVATANTSATNIDVGVPFDLTVNTSAAEITSGQVLAFEVLKAGSGGLDLDAHTFVVEVESE